MKGFEATGRMTVGKFEKLFHDEFGVYCDIIDEKGNFAEESETLANLRPENFDGPKKVDFSLRANMQVANVIKKVRENFGVKIIIYNLEEPDPHSTLASVSKLNFLKRKKSSNKNSEISESKIIRITVSCTGGNYTCGIVHDEDTKENIRFNIDEESVQSTMFFEDGTVFDSSEYDNIVGAYGPTVPESTILVEESNEINTEDDEERNYKELKKNEIDGTDVNWFVCSSPNLDELEDIEEDDLVFFNKKIEKRINYTVLLELNKNEEIDLKNIFLGTVMMDELFGEEDYILHEVLYITKDKASEYIKEFLGENYNNEDNLADHIEEIYGESLELRGKIRNNHLIQPIYVGGKGEWESDYVKVTDTEGDILFEGEDE